MLIGEYSYTIDSKKRLAIPSKLRRELGREVVITRGLDKCLFLYPMKEWKILVSKLNTLPIGHEKTRSFVRIMLSGGTNVIFDRLGRILIPDFLKKYASLKKKITIIGVYSRLEIWDETKWQAYKSKVEKNTDEIAEKLGELGV